ncbi:hypothetical protein E4U21_006194 [Claviceps maximensis]|nr:hypothetical protein E4U21_006194 [Claviceps maximensis]
MPSLKSPSLTRFLSDFTLGFSDGLTVPFALTAGLSSLGRTDTVVYAGLAELCAGSISMGIGGYLSARDETPRPRREGRCSGGGDEDEDEADGEDEDEDGDEEQRSMLRPRDRSSFSNRQGVDVDVDEDEDEKEQEQQAAHEAIVRRHLEPLCLPHQTTLDIVTLLRNRPDGTRGPALRVQKLDAIRKSAAEKLASTAVVSRNATVLPAWPVVSGLSISLGYVTGGIIPLLPYLFAPTIGQGLRWSIARFTKATDQLKFNDETHRTLNNNALVASSPSTVLIMAD